MSVFDESEREYNYDKVEYLIEHPDLKPPTSQPERHEYSGDPNQRVEEELNKMAMEIRESQDK